MAESPKQPEETAPRILNPFDAPDDFPGQEVSSANGKRDQERKKLQRSSKIGEKHVINHLERKHVSEIALTPTSPRDDTFKHVENQETPAAKTVSVEKETKKNDKGEQGTKLEPTIPLPNASTTDGHDESRTPSNGQCIKCKTAAATVIFLPCNHKITCKGNKACFL